MSQTPSTFRVIGLVLLATLIGGLLFAQGVATDDPPAASPSDKKAVADEAESEETAEVTSDAEVRVAEEPEDVPERMDAPAAAATPDKIDSQDEADTRAAWRRVLGSLTIFVLAIFVGFEVITKVPPTLHTPLMSGANAISGITLVGAVIVAATMSFSGFVGFIAVTLATVNAVGGFMVTHRMLAMFKKR
jgi:NAD(P) transhydrogenase subunit alpha